MPIRPISSARLFSRFTRGENMSNQISRIRVTAKKKICNKSKRFFDALLFSVFQRPSISSLQNEECMVGSIHLCGEREVGSKRDFFSNVSAVCVSAFQEPLYEAL